MTSRTLRHTALFLAAGLLGALLTACGPAAPTSPTTPVLTSPEVQACAAAEATPAVTTVNTASIRVTTFRWCVPPLALKSATVEFSKTVFTQEAQFDAFRAAYISCEKANADTDACVRQFSTTPGVTFRSTPTV